MELYLHNQKALDAIINSYDTGKKHACIIHPTGTGKTYIVAGLIKKRPENTFLIITPSDYIGLEYLKIIPEGRSFIVNYQTFINYTAEELKQLHYDYIVLDEFHRAGSPVWGEKIAILFEANPESFKLGLSATHIRHLDNRRNMADELFKSNIVSQLSLNECFVKGILPSPKYVAALYSVNEEAKRLTKKILASDHRQKQVLADQLKKNIIDWEKTGGLPAVLKKHLTTEHKRIIVFAPNIKSMLNIEKILMPILDSIFLVKYFKVHSLIGISKNTKMFAEFSEPSQHVHVMFCVDMLNEGIHVSGVTAEIMVRDTTSPTIYYQQLGRCLTTGKNDVQPLIIDLVNNFRKINISTFKRDYAGAKKGMEADLGRGHIKSELHSVIFFDETKSLIDMFSIFSNAIEKWNMYYEDAKAFFKKHGHLRVPKKQSVLFDFISRQRYYHKHGKLGKEKKEALNSLKMDWAPEKGKTFDERISELTLFIKENNREPCANGEEKGLAMWLYQQRKRAENNYLPTSDIKKLKKIVDVDMIGDQRFKESFSLLKAFYDKNGHSDIKSTDGKKIWNIVKGFRKAYKHGKIPYERKQLLIAIDFNFAVKVDWQTRFNEYKKYISDTKKMIVSPSEKQLYLWVTVQRKNFKLGKMPSERIEQLKKIDFDFKPIQK